MSDVDREEAMASRLRVAALVGKVEPLLKAGALVADVRPDLITAGHSDTDVDEAIEAVTNTKTGTVRHLNTQANSDSTDLQAKYLQILFDKTVEGRDKPKHLAAATLDAMHHRGRFYFHAERKDFATAMFFDEKLSVLRRIGSDEFQAWLASWTGLNRADRHFDFVLSAVETEALSGKTNGTIPAAYWATAPSAIYLSNGDGRAVRITAGQVESVDNGADGILFAAGQTLRPWSLTTPSDPFMDCGLFRDARFVAGHGLDLVRLWVLSLPMGQRCKPPLVVSGPIGSGKTRLVVGVFELFGIPDRVTAIEENGESDFWTALNTGGLVCFDNADTRTRWLPDALASASTDGSKEKRQLYSDSSIVRQRARAWVAITSSNPTFAADAGLADRLLVVRLDRRNTDTAESALSDEIVLHRDAGLSWIARTLAATLADNDPTPANLNRRHPDFASFAIKLGRAMGREREAIAALKSAEADKSLFNLQNDEIGAALLGFMADRGTFTGTAGDLLTALKAADPTFDDAAWKAGGRLGKRITKLWSHLESFYGASSEPGRGRVVRYTFRAPVKEVKEMGSFPKTLPRELHRDFMENTLKPSSPSPLPASEAAGLDLKPSAFDPGELEERVAIKGEEKL